MTVGNCHKPAEIIKLEYEIPMNCIDEVLYKYDLEITPENRKMVIKVMQRKLQDIKFSTLQF